MKRVSTLPLVLGVFLGLLSGCSSGTPSSTSQSQVSNPPPAVTGITPSSLSAGSGPQAISIAGSGFVSASTAYFNGSALQTTYTSATSLQATVPAALLGSGQAASVTVSSPAPGGGNSNVVSFPVMAPTPVLTSFTPNYVLQGTTAALLITGTGFEANSSALLNGSAHTTNFVSSTSLQVPLSAADTQTAGSAQVAVNNPGPGGSTSAASSFVVYAAPTVSAISPNAVAAGALSLALSVTGTNFNSGSQVQVDGVTQLTTFVNATTLQATVSAAALSNSRVAGVTVHNPAPTLADSAAVNLQVNNPAPSLTLLNPSAVASGQAATVTVSGTGFVAASSVLWNGSARTTTYVSATTLKAALTAADLQSAGTGQITVSNGAPGGGTSAALTLAVVTPPTLTSISPSTLQVTSYSTSTTTPLTLTGSNFAANAFATLGGYKLTPVSVTATQMVLAVPNSMTGYAGPLSVLAVNPGTGLLGFASQALTLNLINPSATFTVTPNSAAVGSAATTITLYGGGFFADSVVQWNGAALPTKFGTSTSLTATVPATLLSMLGTAVISVNTPENLGQATPTQGFSTYVNLQVNDLVWNAVDGLIYATVPGTTGQGVGNSLVGIDPNTGAVLKTIFVGSEPNRLAISTDGTQAFVGLNGAGAYRQVNLVTGVAGVQVTLGGGPGVYNPPYTAAGLAAVPGQPNSVAVYASSGVTTIYDAGVARTRSSGNAGYFSSAAGTLSFGSTASTLYLNTGTVTAFTVDGTGITSANTLSSSNSNNGTGVQYDKARLYLSSGTVDDAVTGTQLGQFSVPGTYSSTPVPASGPIVSDSALNRAFVLLSTGVSVFDEATFNLVGSIPSTLTSSYTYANLDLIRWGQNGLAFHNGSQLVILQSALVKDNSGTPVDLSVTAQAPATSATGTSFATQFQVTNSGANSAAGVTLTFALPASVIPGAVTVSQGSCSGTGTVFCDLGSLAAAASATVTVNAVPTVSGALQVTAIAGTQSFDSNTVNNQATASTTVSGSAYNLQPTLSSLSPNLAAMGSTGFTLTVTGTGFASGSVINWNGGALPTTFVSSSSLTATIDPSLLKTLGWANVNVSTPGPGGGTSGSLTETIYNLIALPANAMVYDPFTRKLWTALPSSSTVTTGNSLVTLDPNTGTIGTPVQIGSEPNALAETTSGNYLYVGVSGAKSLSRFNLMSQKVDATVPLVTTGYFGGATAANAVVTIPGVDTSVDVPNVGILDFSGSTATVRPNSILSYADAVFTDSGHAYTFDNYSSGAEFYRYTVDASGVHQVDGTTLLGMGGFQGSFAIENGIGYGAAGGILNPTTTPPTQIATMPLGTGPYSSALGGGGVIPYTAEHKSFNIAYNAAGTWLVFAERQDTQHFQLEDQLQLPTGNAVIQTVAGTRWGQDGLAYLINAGLGGSNPSEIMVLRGPFVLPAEGVTNAAPALTSVGSGSVAVGSGNLRLVVTGSGFMPGASVVWNGTVHDTTFVDSGTLSVAVASSELASSGTVSVTCRNPGSTDSNAVSISIH